MNNTRFFGLSLLLALLLLFTGCGENNDIDTATLQGFQDDGAPILTRTAEFPVEDEWGGTIRCDILIEYSGPYEVTVATGQVDQAKVEMTGTAEDLDQTEWKHGNSAYEDTATVTLGAWPRGKAKITGPVKVDITIPESGHVNMGQIRIAKIQTNSQAKVKIEASETFPDSIYGNIIAENGSSIELDPWRKIFLSGVTVAATSGSSITLNTIVGLVSNSFASKGEGSTIDIYSDNLIGGNLESDNAFHSSDGGIIRLNGNETASNLK